MDLEYPSKTDFNYGSTVLLKRYRAEDLMPELVA